MDIPKNRFEFEKRINALSEYSSEGRLNITMGSYGVARDLKKAKFLPNGRVNLNTIGSSVRLTANMVSHMNSQD